MKHTSKPPNPSRATRRRAEALFNKRRARELKAMAADEERPGVARFTPAEPRARRDGWTAARQRAFIGALADCGSVTTAAGIVKLTPRSAYTLRRHPTAWAFRHAWDRAMEHATRIAADEATARAISGTVVPHYYKGERVGEHVRHNDQLVLRLLAARDPYRFAARPDPDRAEQWREGSADALEDALDAIDGELAGTPEGRRALALAFHRTMNPPPPAQADEGRREVARRLEEMAERLALPLPWEKDEAPPPWCEDRELPPDPAPDAPRGEPRVRHL